MGARIPELEPVSYTLPQAAKALGISVDTLYRLIDADEIPVQRIARRVLISRQALADWSASNPSFRFPSRPKRPNEKQAS